MFELWTVPLGGQEFEDFLTDLRGSTEFKEFRDPAFSVRLTVDCLPNVDRFEVQSKISVAYAPVDLAVDRMTEVWSSLVEFHRSGGCNTVRFRCEVVAEEVPPGCEESTEAIIDLVVGVRIGTKAGISMRAASKGRNDLGYRVGLFNDFLTALNLHAETSLNEKNELVLSTGVEADVLHRMDAGVFADPDKVIIVLGGGHNPGKDFSEIGLYRMLKEDEVVDGIARLHSLYRRRVAEPEILVDCGVGDYPRLKHLPKETAGERWAVKFMAKNPYRLKDLREAMNADEFYFHAFSLKVPKLCTLDADLSKEQNKYLVRFYCEELDGEGEVAIRDYMKRLAGRDILDHEPS